VGNPPPAATNRPLITVAKQFVSTRQSLMTDALFSYLPKAKILAAFARSPGNELASGKFASPESSAALAANTFGLFLDRPGDLPAIPGTADFGWPATYVGVEVCAPFPWRPRGQHPWLDAFAETATHIIGVESKRYEPFRTKKPGIFSKAYWRLVWGNEMRPYERMRDLLRDDPKHYAHLDGVQLVKHAFGLRTEGRRRDKRPALVYLHAEPETWPDGKPIDVEAKRRHAAEAQDFAEAVAGAEVAFRACTYGDLLRTFANSPSTDVRRHGALVKRTFRPGKSTPPSASKHATPT
jgi:hypothetical protein